MGMLAIDIPDEDEAGLADWLAPTYTAAAAILFGCSDAQIAALPPGLRVAALCGGMLSAKLRDNRYDAAVNAARAAIVNPTPADLGLGELAALIAQG